MLVSSQKLAAVVECEEGCTAMRVSVSLRLGPKSFSFADVSGVRFWHYAVRWKTSSGIEDTVAPSPRNRDIKL
jgi:hypothetical protein